MQKLGVSEPARKRILNHKGDVSRGATGLYSRHEYDDEARKAMARWSNKLREIITGKKQKVVSIG